MNRHKNIWLATINGFRLPTEEELDNAKPISQLLEEGKFRHNKALETHLRALNEGRRASSTEDPNPDK